MLPYRVHSFGFCCEQAGNSAVVVAWLTLMKVNPCFGLMHIHLSHYSHFISGPNISFLYLGKRLVDLPWSHLVFLAFEHTSAVDRSRLPAEVGALNREKKYGEKGDWGKLYPHLIPRKLLKRVGLWPAAAAGGGGGHRCCRRWRFAPGTSQQDGTHCLS